MEFKLKELLYWPENDVRPTGGPRGYIYNLLTGLAQIEHPDFDVDCLPSRISENNALRNRIRNWTPKRLRDLKRLRKIKGYATKSMVPSVNFNDYDVVHFHQVEDLYFVREALDSYHGKVVLTSHTPCAPQQEWLSRLNPRDVIANRDELTRLNDIAEFAFDRADYIVFPCAEAEEPYYNTWNEYSDIHQRNADKYTYILTGINSCSVKQSRREVRKQLGITESDFIVSYIGRHNHIKGYDRLIEYAPMFLEDPHTWMVVAGKQGEIHSSKYARWVEVGWTDDPYSIMAASDVFILPNRETYFDLALLEALSLGVPIVTTNTGGNKIFAKLDATGIILLDEIEMLPNAIKYLRRIGKVRRETLGQSNYQLFLENFRSDVFAKNYITLIKSLQ